MKLLPVNKNFLDVITNIFFVNSKFICLRNKYSELCKLIRMINI